MVDITGKRDAIAIKERYQEALNQFHHEIKRKVDWLYGMNHKLKDALSKAQKYKKDIDVDEDEKVKLYQALGNLLSKETNFEKDMWKTTQKGRKVKSIVIKQKFKDSDIEEAKFDAMEDYLKQYPEYTSKSSFKRILDKIGEIEKGIKETKKKYNYEVSQILRELSYFPRNIMEAEDKIDKFRKILKEGNERLKKMRYLRSIIYRLSSQKEKLKVNIDILYYKVEEYERTIRKIKEEVEKARRQELEEIEY